MMHGSCGVIERYRAFLPVTEKTPVVTLRLESASRPTTLPASIDAVLAQLRL
jgi:hypothetical protein